MATLRAYSLMGCEHHTTDRVQLSLCGNARCPLCALSHRLAIHNTHILLLRISMARMQHFQFAPSMMYLPIPRSKRNTASMMLLVWLFAVASGIVNACGLEARGDHAQVVTSEALGAAHARNAPAGPTPDADDQDGDELDISKAPCLKVCDDGSQALLKLKTFVDLADRGSSLTDSMLWAVAIPLVSVQGHMDNPPTATSEPPVRVRYSRLAL